jgi:hypothetical protein
MKLFSKWNNTYMSLVAIITISHPMIVGVVANEGSGAKNNVWNRKSSHAFVNRNELHRHSKYYMDKKDMPSIVSSIRGGGGGKTKTIKKESSIVSSVFNLVNNVAGAGILTLASGVAPGTGVIPAIIICFTLGTLSGHCFSIIGDACELTGESDFKGLWMKTIGPNSAYMVDTMIAVMCLSCSVIYSGILGDVFTPLFKQAGFPDGWNGRTSNIIAITISLLLPLSLIKDLSKLAFTSILGFSAILYTVMFIIIRAFDGSYKLPAGKFLQDGLITVRK